MHQCNLNWGKEDYCFNLRQFDQFDQLNQVNQCFMIKIKINVLQQ